jgi:hypothetical protein
MKLSLKHAVPALLAAFLWQAGIAQTATTNPESWSTLIPSGSCTNCTINIPAGFTLNLNSAGTCNGCTFTGGTVNITSGFTLNNNTTTFNNDTLLINASINPKNFVFNNDSVAINASLTNQTGTDIVSNCRISVNAGLSFQSATLTNDSIHLNSTLNFSNSPATFSGCNVDIANGETITTQGSSFSNSVFHFAGNSSMQVNNTMTSDGSSFYLGDSSFIKSSGTTTVQNNSNIVMLGKNSFQASNAFTLSGSTVTMDSTSTLSASALTATSSTITMNNSAKMSISNAINLTGTNLTMNNSSTLSGSSATVQSTSTLTMNGNAALSVSNTFDIKSSNVYLNGNSSLSDNATTVENASNLVVGDGSLASTAHLFTTNTVSVLDSSLLKISNGNNYLHTNANNFTGGATSYPIKTNTISCNSGATTGFANSCASGFVYGCATLNSAGAVACVTLAVADLNLSASASGPDAVTVSWTDAAQPNTDHFVVERSADGNAWSAIGTVGYQRTAEQDFTYHFTDADALNGNNAYRLQMVDQDGGVIYSKIITVTLANNTGQISVYPNPVRGQTIHITTLSTDPALVKIFSLSGQLLLLSSLKGQTHYQVLLPSNSPHNSYLVVQVIGAEKTQAFTLMNL